MVRPCGGAEEDPTPAPAPGAQCPAGTDPPNEGVACVHASARLPSQAARPAAAPLAAALLAVSPHAVLTAATARAYGPGMGLAAWLWVELQGWLAGDVRAGRRAMIPALLLTFVFDDPAVYAWGGESIVIHGQPLGELSSVGWGLAAGRCVALR